jgi:GAF domain-containing protein
LMAVPLIVSNEVLGAVVFLHDSDPQFFRPDHTAKASILASQLGGLLEAARLSERAREEQRRAGILAEVARSLHSEPDPASLPTPLPTGCASCCVRHWFAFLRGEKAGSISGL